MAVKDKKVQEVDTAKDVIKRKPKTEVFMKSYVKIAKRKAYLRQQMNKQAKMDSILFDIKNYIMGANSSITFTKEEWLMIYKKLCEAIKDE